MEKKFRVLTVCMMVLAVFVIGGVFGITVMQLSGTEERMDGEDRAAFASFLTAVSDPEGLVRVQILRRTSINDFTRYGDFDRAMLKEMEFVHHEYLYGGEGKVEGDIYVKLTLRSTEEGANGAEVVVMQQDGDLYRVEYRGASFVVRCDRMTEWIEFRNKWNNS